MAIFKLADLAGNSSVFNEKYILFMSDAGASTTEFVIKYPTKNSAEKIIVNEVLATILVTATSFIACASEGTDIALDKAKVLSAVDLGTGSVVTYDAGNNVPQEIIIDIDTDALVA